MTRPHHPHPEWSPRKKPLSRHFKNFEMPPVPHPLGAVPEAFLPRLDPRRTKNVLFFLAGILVLFGFWYGIGAVRRRLHAGTAGIKVCCGCGQHPETSSCPSKGTCPITQVGGSGCLDPGAPAQGAHLP